MSLEIDRNKLALRIERDKKELVKNQILLERLLSCKEPTFQELYSDIEKYVTITTKVGSYEHILGGDGRSGSFSEERTGRILTIIINDGIYLTSELFDIVKKYVSHMYSYDTIRYKAPYNIGVVY